MTHPFHPLAGCELVFVARQGVWRGDFVFFLDDEGHRQHIEAGWTDVAAEDAFRAVAAGRCAFRIADLLAVAGLVDLLRKRRGQGGTDGHV